MFWLFHMNSFSICKKKKFFFLLSVLAFSKMQMSALVVYFQIIQLIAQMSVVCVFYKK